MVFSGLFFLFVFLPLFLAVYFLTPARGKNVALLLFSLLFYGLGEPKLIWLILASSLTDYTAGRALLRYQGKRGGKAARIRKAALVLSLCVNLLLLGVFKYGGFMVGNFNRITGAKLPLFELALPLGISFYTFQTMSYTIDCYRGRVQPQKSLIAFGAYVTSFPQLIAGPIVTYGEVAREINQRSVSLLDFAEGIQRFSFGLVKKVFLANQSGMLWEAAKGWQKGEIPAGLAWLGILGFAFQIYFDFSGYSDMAIGLGRMMGFHFPENFSYPYLSQSIGEFFRRWHITLGRWFREYIYIPLGGNQRGLAVTCRNLMIVWFLTGLWHGAAWNFIVWGLFFGGLLVLERIGLGRLLEKLPKLLRYGYVWLAVLAGWALFANDSLKLAAAYLKAMVPESLWPSGTTLYYVRNYFVVLLLCAIFSTPQPKRIYDACPKGAQYAISLALFLISVVYLVDASYNPFLYFRF